MMPVQSVCAFFLSPADSQARAAQYFAAVRSFEFGKSVTIESNAGAARFALPRTRSRIAARNRASSARDAFGYFVYNSRYAATAPSSFPASELRSASRYSAADAFSVSVENRSATERSAGIAADPP